MKNPGVSRIWLQPATMAGLFVLFLLAAMARQPAAAIVADGSWMPVESATVVQGARVYARGVGYYTDNTITNAGAAPTGELRLVVTSSTYPVTNADGSDGGMPYFNLASLSDVTRIYFAFTRAAFAYTAEVQQYVIAGPVDSDGDGVPDDADLCPGFDDAIDVDGDGTPDGCDSLLDSDNDGVGDDVDQCPGFDDAIDIDGDGTPDGCDSLIDSDSDGVGDDVDQCPGFDDAIDIDGDGTPDGCDSLIDSDSDGVGDDVDQCPGFDDAIDVDGDGTPDGCDDAVAVDRDEDGIPDNEDICPDDPTNACITITGQVFGDGATLSGASVKIGTNSVLTSTDEAGYFEAAVGNPELSNDSVDYFFPVEVKIAGFATGNAKVLFVPGKQSYDVTVSLQQVSETVDAEDDLNAGVAISVGGQPVGSLTIPDSSLPAGVTEVNGSITYLDPETDDILSAPGGDLLAVPEGADPNDDPVTLETFGMMEFDLKDQDGNEITELDAPAEVCMKAPAGLSLGDTVPLWYYDEQAGLWKEEGQGTVVDRDGQLQICGQVVHFTWWNYDQPINTHSCFHFRLVDAVSGTPLSGFDWRAEGVTYSGTSPERDCADSGTGTTWDSLTVKISDDPLNPEQIRVFATIGGSKYYLRRDSEEQYSLVANANAATVFDTPTVQGSCLSGTESGNCQPLDFLDVSPDGVLQVSSDINLPPVISEFVLSDYTIGVSETMDATVTVTDPEGAGLVNLAWSVDCDYWYGGGTDDESINPIVDSGASGGTFVAQVTAPSALSSPFEQCLVTLQASDAEGNTSTATRWFTVAGSYDYIFTGIVHGTDGQPLVDTFVSYNNYCNGASINESSQTDAEGRYYFEVNLAQCIGEGGEYYYYGLGDLYVDFQAPDGNFWSHYVYLEQYYGELGSVSNCSVTIDGSTYCETDVRLPMLWAPLSGDVYKSLSSDVIWSVDSYDYNYYYGYGYSYSSLWGLAGPLSGVHDGTAYGPVMVPLGNSMVYPYEQSGPLSWSWVPDGQVYFSVPSLDGVVQDLTDSSSTTAPVTVTVFDELGAPLPGVEVDAYPYVGSIIIDGGITDANGQVSGIAPLGAMYAYEVQQFDYASGVVSRKDQPVFVDINSPDTCSYSGTLFDSAGLPLASTDVWIQANSSTNGYESVQLTTDANGSFDVEFPAVYSFDVYTLDGSLYSGYQEIFVPNCRPVGGAQPVIRLDYQIFQSPYDVGIAF